MSKLCHFCAAVPFLDLPPFPNRVEQRQDPLTDQESGLLLYVRAKEHGGDGDHDLCGYNRTRVNLGLKHHASLQALIRSAESCELCALIAEGVNGIRVLLREELGHAGATEDASAWQSAYELFISAREHGAEGFLVWSQSVDPSRYFVVAAIGYCVDDDSPLSHVIRGRPFLEDPGSPLAFDRIRGWLRDCRDRHPECRYVEADLPLRVLDLAPTDAPPADIRLIEPSPGTKGVYATLSHCWGSSRHFSTTTTTLRARKAGIDVSDLPLTLRDAVRAARELGIRYLWIDSLCILQDDEGDWQRESAKMTHIYRGAYVCIAAARAASDSDGFLAPRPRSRYVAVSVPATSLRTSSSPAPHRAEPCSAMEQAVVTGVLKLSALPHHSAAAATSTPRWIEAHNEPLSSRAWALQERLLSRRLVHFGTRQAAYKCAAEFLTEDGFVADARPYNVADGAREEAAAAPVVFAGEGEVDGKSPAGTGSGVGREVIGLPGRRYRGRGGRWYEIVRLYADLKLSRRTDKFPALAGLAALFAERLGDDYVAGLWRGDVVQGLAYTFVHGAGTGDPLTTVDEGEGEGAVEVYRAPSWSWASRDTAVAYAELDGWTDLVDVVSVDVQVQGENPFGEVCAGELVLEGVLEELYMYDAWRDGATNGGDIRSDAALHGSAGRYRLKTLDGTEIRAEVMSDIPETHMDLGRLRQESAFALPLALRPAHLAASTSSTPTTLRYGGDVVFGLWVTPVAGQQHTFLRRGAMYVTDEILVNKWKIARANARVRNVCLI